MNEIGSYEEDCYYCETTTTEYYYNNSSNYNTTEWEWPPIPHIVITSTLLILLILVTIIGNVFVILAVFKEKNLQNSVANYLIVSLAVADLMVACLVMPLGALYEIAGNKWILGAAFCDMWTSSDVLACTASILHLVAIAVDRFWAVTDIEYIRSRNRTRINTMILLVWLVAFTVSLAPILGWKDPYFYSRLENEKKCLISQDVGYQIFATCATFYVPLFVILLLYWKIFQTARRRIRRRPGRIGMDKLKEVIIADEGSSRLTTECPEGSASSRASPPKTILISRETTGDLSGDLTPPGPDNKKSETIESFVERTERGDEIRDCDDNSNGSSGLIQMSKLPLPQIPQPLPSPSLSPNRNQLSIPFTITQPQILLPRKKNKESIEAKRERKAAKTLAIITGAFVMCWLPFFVMALTLALCPRCELPVYVESSFLWLGYFNSTLNPIIYTLFSPEFRQAFKRILCGRNRTRRR